MTDTINGWTPPLIHDLSTDSRRIATQADVDDLMMIRDAYNMMRGRLQEIIQHNHEGLGVRLASPHRHSLADYKARKDEAP